MSDHHPIVSTRTRADGWTLDRQRAFLEALADCGSVRGACARVGISPQAAYSLRRRSDARAFAQAWDAARAMGARRLEEVAWDRAVNGTVRQHFYHGELVAETRVYSDRLLSQLLEQNRDLMAMTETDPEILEEVIADWDGALDRVGTDDWLRTDAEWEAECLAGLHARPASDEGEAQDAPDEGDESGDGGETRFAEITRLMAEQGHDVAALIDPLDQSRRTDRVNFSLTPSTSSTSAPKRRKGGG